MQRESSKSLPGAENINAIFDFPSHPSVYYDKYKTREISRAKETNEINVKSENTWDKELLKFHNDIYGTLFMSERNNAATRCIPCL